MKRSSVVIFLLANRNVRVRTCDNSNIHSNTLFCSGVIRGVKYVEVTKWRKCSFERPRGEILSDHTASDLRVNITLFSVWHMENSIILSLCKQ